MGENRTNMALVARARCEVSPCNKSPFVSVNWAAIPTGLLKSELFGYERGPLSERQRRRSSGLNRPNEVLFLDEVGDIPLDIQPNLLRVLQKRPFRDWLGQKPSQFVRLVAATNRGLTQMMNEKVFRRGLECWLMIFSIISFPFRNHPEHILILVRYFVRKQA